MPGNSFGKLFVLTTFGESHGVAIGGIIDGCPPGLGIDSEYIQSELDRRRPGQSKIVTQRKESDSVEFLSGIFEGKTTGTPIGFIIKNEDQKSKDYEHLKEVYRPSHADYTYDKKYGVRDYRGGGRSSARETACRVVAGAVAKLLLKQHDIEITAYVSQVGEVKLEEDYQSLDLSGMEKNSVRCPHPAKAEEMISVIEKTRKEGNTIGGVISCVIKNIPAGLGEPVFDKLHADLGKAMLSINAAKGFEYGSGFSGVSMKGSEHNDEFYNPSPGLSPKGKGANLEGDIRTKTNYSGGIQGGISNGEDIYFRVAFKPVATLMQPQKTVDKEGRETEITGKGRHDACVVPRAVPIVEAMAALVLADHLLRQSSFRS